VFTGPEGLTVTMRNGLSIYFGDGTRPHAKWLSAARVLADPSSAGATYVDVRLPERPAAGTPAASGLEGAAAAPAQVSASDPSAAALAAALAAAVNGTSTPTASQQPSSSPTQTAPEEASTSTSG
jgi:cell division protein FtsQ